MVTCLYEYVSSLYFKTMLAIEVFLAWLPVYIRVCAFTSLHFKTMLAIEVHVAESFSSQQTNKQHRSSSGVSSSPGFHSVPFFLPHNVCAYFLCGLMCTWIHETDAELICMRFFFFFFFFFFSDVLTYCVMLQAFICYCFFVRCF